MFQDWTNIAWLVGGVVILFVVLSALKRRRAKNWTKAARGDLLRDRERR